MTMGTIPYHNKKILIIMYLCCVLDYIQVITLILCKMYATNNFYFYSYIIPIQGFCTISWCCVTYFGVMDDRHDIGILIASFLLFNVASYCKVYLFMLIIFSS